MKKMIIVKKFRILSLLFGLFLLTVACRGAVSDPVATGDLAPTARDKSIAVYFSRLLESKHVFKDTYDFNEMCSTRAFDLYLKALDPMKIYFTQADIDAFRAAYQSNLGTMIKKGDLTPAFAIYNRFIQRVDERCNLAHQILDSKLDFTTDEYLVLDKDLLDYPKDEVEIYDRMRKEIKAKILSQEAADADEAKEEAEEKEKQEEGQEGTSAEEASNEPDAEVATADTVVETPIEKLHRRYNSMHKRIHQVSNDDILEIFLTAVANAYDPHSSYMSPKTFENFAIQMRLNLDGIGATLGWEDGYTIVKGIVKGGAADKQGELKVEDRIIGVAQGKETPFEDVVDMNLSDVVGKIRGKRGTLVRLEVLTTKGKGPKKVIEIVREKIELEDSAAQSKVFEAGQKADGTPWKIGVIDLPSFYFDMEARSRGDSSGRSTTRDVRKILRQFVLEDVDACVIDLRYNGGGSLQEVVDLTGLFIETGSVVQVKPSELDRRLAKPLDDRDPSVEWGGPLVVMTSKFSASASEIFAGAIQDYKRGIIVGDETTHGKGTVQPLIEISELLFGPLANAPNFGTLKVSIQGFYLPHGESTQLSGVHSDLVLPSLTNYTDSSEADSDYPLSFEKIPAAVNYPIFDYVNPQIVASLAKLSQARVAASDEFAKLQKNIDIYKEIKEEKKTTLNREKFFAERERLNIDKEEKDEYEKLMGMDQKIHRDYYMNEVLDITADYLNLLNQLGIGFPGESQGQTAAAVPLF